MKRLLETKRRGSPPSTPVSRETTPPSVKSFLDSCGLGASEQPELVAALVWFKENCPALLDLEGELPTSADAGTQPVLICMSRLEPVLAALAEGGQAERAAVLAATVLVQDLLLAPDDREGVAKLARIVADFLNNPGAELDPALLHALEQCQLFGTCAHYHEVQACQEAIRKAIGRVPVEPSVQNPTPPSQRSSPGFGSEIERQCALGAEVGDVIEEEREADQLIRSINRLLDRINELAKTTNNEQTLRETYEDVTRLNRQLKALEHQSCGGQAGLGSHSRRQPPPGPGGPGGGLRV